MLCLVVLEVHVVTIHPHHFDLTCSMGHDELEPLAVAVQHGFRLFDDPVGVVEGDLEIVLYPFHGPALEDIIRVHTDPDEIAKEFRKGFRIIVHPPQQNGLIAHNDAGIEE